MRHILSLLEGDSKGIAMPNRDSTRQLRAAAGALALALALGLSVVGWSTPTFAEDDEDVPLDTKILRQFLKDWGLRRDGENDVGIDYRERAPLVVPPSRSLPKPQDEAAVTNSPAWPTDPDVKRRKQATAAEKARLRGGVSAEDQARPLRPAELDQPGKKSSDGQVVAGPTAEDSARPMTPGELGAKKLFGGIFSSFAPAKPEIAEFKGEPPRASMTAPPSGYQTPSPNQPYGLGVKRDTYKPSTLEERLEGQRQ
jgi:hypothetical protein